MTINDIRARLAEWERINRAVNESSTMSLAHHNGTLAQTRYTHVILMNYKPDVRALLDALDAASKRAEALEDALRDLRDNPPTLETTANKTYLRGFNTGVAICRDRANAALQTPDSTRD